MQSFAVKDKRKNKSDMNVKIAFRLFAAIQLVCRSPIGLSAIGDNQATHFASGQPWSMCSEGV
jgi:hypothetical protein